MALLLSARVTNRTVCAPVRPRNPGAAFLQVGCTPVPLALPFTPQRMRRGTICAATRIEHSIYRFEKYLGASPLAY
jgi:hypothetical protein